MESTKIILYMLEALLVVGILVMIVSYMFGPDRVQDVAQQELTQPLVITMTTSDVNIVHNLIGATNFYDLTVTPKISAVGSVGEGQDVIAIIRFKEQSLIAKVNGANDFFTIGPDKDIVEPVLHASFSSDVPPIAVYDGAYPNGALRENQKIVIKSGEYSALFSVSIYRINTPLPDFIDGLAFSCKAVFRIEGGCVPGKIKFTNSMTGNDCEETPSNCYQSIDVCDGAAIVQIFSEPDCASDIVNTRLEYSGGTKFDVGETVLVSFWKKTTCTENKSDFQQLITLCPKDRIGGEFSINAGILPGFGG